MSTEILRQYRFEVSFGRYDHFLRDSVKSVEVTYNGRIAHVTVEFLNIIPENAKFSLEHLLGEVMPGLERLEITDLDEQNQDRCSKEYTVLDWCLRNRRDYGSSDPQILVLDVNCTWPHLDEEVYLFLFEKNSI